MRVERVAALGEVQLRRQQQGAGGHRQAFVAGAQQQGGGEVAAGGDALDHDPLGSVGLQEAAIGGHAVVQSRGIGVIGRHAVVDGVGLAAGAQRHGRGMMRTFSAPPKKSRAPPWISSTTWRSSISRSPSGVPTRTGTPPRLVGLHRRPQLGGEGGEGLAGLRVAGGDQRAPAICVGEVGHRSPLRPLHRQVGAGGVAEGDGQGDGAGGKLGLGHGGSLEACARPQLRALPISWRRPGGLVRLGLDGPEREMMDASAPTPRDARRLRCGGARRTDAARRLHRHRGLS